MLVHDLTFVYTSFAEGGSDKITVAYGRTVRVKQEGNAPKSDARGKLRNLAERPGFSVEITCECAAKAKS